MYGVALSLSAGEKLRQSFKFRDGVDELGHNVHSLSELWEWWGELDL